MRRLKAFRDSIPSKEKASKICGTDSLSIDVSETNEISLLKILSPKLQKKELIIFVELIKNVHIDME